MATAVAPFGLKPVRHLDGSPYNGQHQLFFVPSSDGTAIGVGDTVKFNGASAAVGTICNGMDVGGMMQVVQQSSATTAVDTVGVVVGFLPDPTSLTTRHRAASTNRIAMVCTDPTTIYEIQEDGVGNNVSATMVGRNFGLVIGAANTTTGTSAFTLDSSTNAATATLPLKLIGLSKRPGMDFGASTTDLAIFEVMLQDSFWYTQQVGL